jgi:adenosylcobinamide kinase/adenosylcobinamide-phosphate guanylyltransferase
MGAVDAAMPVELITGPARSGKSRWAEHRITQLAPSQPGGQVHYLATGPDLPEDLSWQDRLRRHRERRPSSWCCQEVGFSLGAALDRLRPSDLALVDSLGTWVSQGLDLDDPTWGTACHTLLRSLERTPSRILLVSEQVGWGVVPATAIGGLFRDRLGLLEETIGRCCNRLWLVVAGRAIDLLPISQPVPPEPSPPEAMSSDVLS